jgi:hypothetical protein
VCEVYSLLGATTLSRFINRSAKPAVAIGEVNNRFPESFPTEIWPGCVIKHQLGISRLPEQEVRDALFPRTPNEEIDVW